MANIKLLNQQQETARKKLLLWFVIFIFLGLFIIYKIYSLKEFSFLIFLCCLIIGLLFINLCETIIKAFQKSTEYLFMQNSKTIFNHLKLDIDHGIKQDIINKLSYINGYIEQESFNALISPHYLFSEELIYEKLGKNERLKNVKFEGSIIELPNIKNDINGKLLYQTNSYKNYGNITTPQKQKLITLMKILNTHHCHIETIENKLYISLKGARLFYQYNILRPVDSNKNISKIKLLDDAITSLIKEF